uniref:Uncharacterized protein LOC100186072 n=1 Tax=Phallusia mammillata TaxID=59560 RepID=A0A6F9DJ36_9ASCI|nr:uncharacterized protein LOC100186072 [Phallusia mammillata]
MEFWTLVLFSLVANGFSRRIDKDSVTCPLTCSGPGVLGYSTGKTYMYQYEALAISRVSGTADQQTGNAGFSSHVAVQVLGTCHFVVNFENIQSSSLSTGSTEMLSESLTKYPLHLSWQDGKIEELCSHDNEDAATLNIKRGFLSAMQNTIKNNPAATESYETDVTGNCLTSYTMESGPGAANTVRKIRDLNMCTGERTRYHTSMLFAKYQADSQRKSLLKSTQDCNQTWTQEGVLSRSDCTEKHVFRPFSYRSKGAESVVTQNLELLNVRESEVTTKVLNEDDVRRTTLSFEEVASEDQISENTDILTNALEEMCDLISPNSPSDLMPAGYIKVVAAMKGLTQSGLRNVWDAVVAGSVCSSYQDKIRQLFVDSLSMCDKESCVQLIVELISSHNVDEAQKSSWMSSMSFIAQPTHEMITAMIPLIQGAEQSKPEPYLTLGSLVYRFCKNNPRCERTGAVQEAIAALQQPLGTNCHTTNEMEKRKIILSLRALGNAGFSTAVPTLHACILELRNSPAIRLAAMNAFRRLTCQADRSAMKQVLGDSQEDSEIRIAAYSAMMRCPSADFIRYVFLLMQNEEVNQVGSYIWNHVMEVKSSSDPLKGYLRALFMNSNLTDKFSKDKRKYSSFYENSLFSETLNIGAALDGDLVWSTKSFIPRSARLNLTVDLFGGAFNLLEVGGRVQGVERALEKVIGPAAQENSFLATVLGIDKTNSRKKREAVTKYDGKLEEIKTRQNDLTKEDDPSASIFMRMFGNEMVFEQFGEEITEQAEAGSWFGGLKTLFNLATGAEYSIQHSRMLLDSSVTVPTVAGFPLTLKVSGASTMDVAFGGQIDLNKILFQGFHVGGYVQPRGTVEIKASMSTDIGVASRSGIDLQTTLTTSMDVNGTVSLTDGENFRVKIDVPQERMDVVNFRSQIFIIQDQDRTSLVPTTTINTANWCTETGSQLLGIQVCTESSSPSYSNNADDERPFFPLAGPVDYKFEIRKTDPTLSYYLLETRYNWQSAGPSSIPDEVTARFFIGTPGSQVDRSRELNLAFTSTADDFNIRLSTVDRSLQLQANKHNQETEKRAGIVVTIDEMQTYSADASLLYETSRTGGHIWNGNAKVITPLLRDAPPTASGSFAYSEGRQMEGRMEVTNVLTQPIVLQADAEKTVENDRVSYNGNGLVQLPGLGNMDGQVRSSRRNGRDRTHLTINYSLFGLEQQTVTLSHKFTDQSSEDESQWSVSTDAAFSQFPSLNHKIQLEHSSSGEQLDSSLAINYGAQYDKKSNTRKLAIKQVLTNLSDEVKTNLEGLWSLSIPEYDVSYRATLRHLFDWTTDQNKMAALSGSFSNSENSNPLLFDLFASDESTQRKTKLEGQVKVTTPWGTLSALQRLNTVQPGKLMSFGNYAIGQASGLQIQMVSNITTMDRQRGFSMHLYRPQAVVEVSRERTLKYDLSFIQPLPAAEDLFLFSSDWTTDSEWVPENDFTVTGVTTLKSLWNDQLDVTTTINQQTTGVMPDILLVKRFNFTLLHPAKEMRFFGETVNEKSTSNNAFENTHLFGRNFTTRMEWIDSTQGQKYIEISGMGNRHVPADGEWYSAENRLDLSLSCNHNENTLVKYIPTDLNIDANVYARPISQSFDVHHEFGARLNVASPSTFEDNSVFFFNDMQVGFTDFSNFDVSRSMRYNIPWTIGLPQNFVSHARVHSRSAESSGLMFNMTVDDNEHLLMEVNVDSNEASRCSGNAKWRQNLSRMFFRALPENVVFEYAAEYAEPQYSVSGNVVVGEDDQYRCNLSASVNTEQPQIVMRMQQNLPYLTDDLQVPSPVQLNLRMINRDTQETSTVLEISSQSEILMTGRVAVTKPENPTVDPYSLRVVFQHNTDLQLPSLSEAVLTAHWNPEIKYGLGLRMALGAQEGDAEISLDLAEGFRLDINHRQGFAALNDLSVPQTSSIVFVRSPDDGNVQLTYRVDSIHGKITGSTNTDRQSDGTIRNEMTLAVTHNSKWLTTTWSVPKKTRMSLTMEGASGSDLPSVSSSLSVNVDLGDKYIRTNLNAVRQNENGSPVSLELTMTANQNLPKFTEAGLPEESDIRFNIHKVNNGFTVRMSQLFDDDRKHVEATIYQRDIMNGQFKGTKLVVQFSHNYQYLQNELGIPERSSASIQIEELDCNVGFWANGELNFGAENSLRATASLNCNGTSLTFAGNSDISGFFVASYGMPETFETHVEVYAKDGDQEAGLIGGVSLDDNSDDFSIHFSIPPIENVQDSYQVSLQHTFETLNTLFNIPFNVSGTFTGKISPWNYAKGNMEIRIDDTYKFFRFNTGYRFNPETNDYKFDYSMRHNLDFTSKTDDTDTPPTKISFGLKMQSGYCIWWDFAIFQERFKGKIGVNADPLTYGFIYNVRHTFTTLDKMGIPKAVEVQASLLAGNNNTFGTDINVEFRRRQIGLKATVMYQPGDETEILELEFGTSHNFPKLTVVPQNFLSKATLTREGASKKTFEFFSKSDDSKTNFDISLMIDPSSYQNQWRYVIDLNRDPVNFNLFAAPEDLESIPISGRISVSKPRDRKRMDGSIGLIFPASNEFHFSLGAGQTRAGEEEMDVALELTNNAPVLRSNGIPDAVHGTANMRTETGETNRSMYSANFRTSDGKHIDIDLNIRQQSQNRYEISYITSQNFQYLSQDLGYPMELQASTRLTTASDQMTARARLMLEQQSHFAQIMIHYPSEAPLSDRTQLSRTLQFSHDIPLLLDQLGIPRDSEVIFNFFVKQDPEEDSWLQAVQEIRPSLTVNVDQVAVIETSVVLRRTNMDVELSMNLQHDCDSLISFGVMRTNRMSAQLQVEVDNQMLEIEWSQDVVEQSVVFRTTNQIISEGTKRAQRELSFSINHRIQSLEAIIPNSMKITARYMVRKVLPAFQVGSTVWFGHSKFDITTELNEIEGTEDVKGYALRFGINQDFRQLIKLGVPETLDAIVSLQPTTEVQGGSLQITVNRNGGKVNTVTLTVTKKHALNVSLVQDVPELINRGFPRNIQTSLFYQGVSNVQQISMEVCYESKCLDTTAFYIYDRDRNGATASFKVNHNFPELSSYNVPVVIDNKVTGNLAPTGLHASLSSVFGENTFKVYSGLNVTLLTGEWSTRTELSHTWRDLELIYSIPRDFAMAFSVKRTNNERCDMVGNYKLGTKVLNTQIVSTSSENGEYGDFTLYESHNFDWLTSMQVPEHLRISGSYQKTGDRQKVNLQTELNRFVVNTTFTLNKPSTGLYEVRMDNNHNVPNLPMSDQLTITITGGSNSNSGYEGELRTQRGRKQNTARITTRKSTTGNNANSFTATLRQDMTSELDESSVWYQLASSVDVNLNANLNSENSELTMQCSVGDQSLEFNYQQERRSDAEWMVTGSVDQSLELLRTTWPEFPASIAITGDVSQIANGYRGDLQLQYGSLTENVQVEGTYGFNRDTRRNELVVRSNHDVARWADEYQVPRHLQATLFYNNAQTDNSRSLNTGVLVQLGDKQIHATLQTSIQDVVVSDSEVRPSLRLSVNAGHDMGALLEQYGFLRTQQVSVETTPITNGMTFQTRVTQDDTENSLSGSIAAEWNEAEQSAVLTIQFSHDMDNLKQDYAIPRVTQLQVSIAAPNKWMEIRASISVTGDDCSFRSATSYTLTTTSLRVEFEQEIRNSPLLEAYVPSTLETNFEVRLEDYSATVSYDQTLNSETSRIEATCGFSTVFTEQVRLEMTLSLAQTFETLTQMGVSQEVRIALAYRKQDERYTISTDVTLGEKLARVSFTLQNAARNVRISMESEQTVVVHLGVPRSVQGSVNFLWSDESLSTALEYSIQPAENNRADVTVTWTRDPTNVRNELQLSFSHNIRELTNVPRENVLTIFCGETKPQSWTGGIEMDLDEKSLQTTVNVKLQPSMLTLTVRGRHSVPWITENWGISRVGKFEMSAQMTEEPMSGRVMARSTMNGVSRQLFEMNVAIPRLSTSGVNLQMNLTHDLSRDVAQSMELTVDASLDNWQNPSSNIACRFGKNSISLVSNGKITENDEGFLYFTATNMQHNIDFLSQYNIPVAYRSNIVLNVKDEESSLKMNSTMQQTESEESKMMTLVLQFLKNETCARASAELTHDMEMIKLPMKTQMSVYVHSQSKMVGMIGYNFVLDQVIRNGDLSWNIQSVEEERTTLTLKMSKSDSNFNFATTVGKNAQNSDSEFVISLNHNCKQLTEQLNLAPVSHLRLFFNVNSQQGSAGFNGSFGEKNANALASYSLSTDRSITVEGELHNNIGIMFDGGKITIMASTISNNARLQTTLIQDASPESPMEVNLHATWGKTLETDSPQNQFHLTFSADHNVNMDWLSVSRSLRAKVTVDTINVYNSSLGGNLMINDAEMASFNTGYIVDEDLRVLSLHFASLQEVTESLSRKLACSLSINGKKYTSAISARLSLTRDDMENEINTDISYTAAVPVTNITAKFNHNFKDIEIPRIVCATVELVLPSNADLIFGIEGALSMDEQTWTAKSVLDMNVYSIGSDKYPLGRMDISYLFTNNLFTMWSVLPKTIDVQFNVTRIGNYIFDSSLSLDVNEGEKMFGVSLSNARSGDKANSIEVQFTLNHNLQKLDSIPRDIQVSASGTKVDGGFSFSIFSNAEKKNTKLGQMLVQQRFNAATNRDEFTLTFSHDSDALRSMYVPAHFELNAYKEISSDDNTVTVYSYDLTAAGISNTCTLTLTPDSFDLTSDHDWVTLTLITGLPYASQINGKISGSFPYKSYNLTYVGDLRRLEATMDVSKRGEGAYAFASGLVHNMKTWKILGLPMRNRLSVGLTTEENSVDGNMTLFFDENTFSTSVVMMKEKSPQVYRMDISTKHNLELPYPKDTSLRGEISISEEPMVNAALTLSLGESETAVVRHTGNFEFQDWPNRGNLETTISFTNNIPMFVEAGVPSSMTVATSMERTAIRQLTGKAQVDFNGAQVFNLAFDKEEGSALQLSLDFGSSYVINVRDSASMEKSGLDLEVEFGEAQGNKSVIGFRSNPDPIIDVTMRLDMPSFIPEDYISGPIMIAVMIDETESGELKAELNAQMGDEEITISVRDIDIQYENVDKWSVTYVLTLQHNVTLMTDRFGLPNNYWMQERTVVDTELEQLLSYQLDVRSNEEEKLSLLFEIEKDVQSDFSHQTTFKYRQSLESLNNIIPQNAVGVLAINAENDDVFGRTMKLNATYEATGDQLMNFTTFCGLGAVGTKFGALLTHQNIELLNNNFPTKDQNNMLEAQFEFVDLTSQLDTSLTARRSLKMLGVVGDRNGQSQFAVERRETDSEFSTTIFDFSLDHNIEELSAAGVSKQVSMKTSAVTYADSAKVDTSVEWSDASGEMKLVNASVQYDGGFPARVYGAHSLVAELNHPFTTKLPSKLAVNGDLELSSTHVSNDWRVRYNDQNQIIAQQRFAASQPGVLQADIMLKQPFEGIDLRSLDISCSVTSQDKTTSFRAKTAINEADPDSISGRFVSLDNELDSRQGYNLKFTVEPVKLAEIFPQLNQPAYLDMTAKKTADTATISANATSGANTFAFTAEGSARRENYYTIEMSTQQPFADLFVANMPVSQNSRMSLVVDKTETGRLDTTFTLNGDMMVEGLLVTMSAMKDYDTTLYGVSGMLRRGDNTDNDKTLSFVLRNGTYENELNYTAEVSMECVGKNLSYALLASYAKSSGSRAMYVIAKYGFKPEEFGLKWNDNVVMDRNELTVLSPYFEPVKTVFERSVDVYGTRYVSSTDLAAAIHLRQTVLVGSDSVTLSSGYSTKHDAGDISIMGRSNSETLFVRCFLEEPVGTQAPQDTDLALASLTRPAEGWMQLKLRSRRESLSKVVLDLDTVEEAFTQIVNLFSENVPTNALTPYMDTIQNKMTQAFTWMKLSVRNIQTSNLQSSYLDQNQQIQQLLSKIGMPLDQLRTAYYDSLIRILKEEVERTATSLFGTTGQTKLGWMVVKYANEIVNHKIDTLDRKLYQLVTGSTPPSSRLVYFGTEQLLINFPTVYSTQSFGVTPAANVVRDWLAGTVATKVIREMLGFNMRNRYYRWMAEWNAETSVPPFPAYASVINNKQIVTFDGKVYDVEALRCAHLLSQDYLDGNFSLVMQRTPESASSYLLKTKNADGSSKTLQIHSNNLVSVNSQAVHLPYEDDTVAITRTHSTIVAVAKHRDVTLTCSMTNNIVCQLQLGPFYHGRVSGLMGSMDNEPENDIVDVNGNKRNDAMEEQDSWAVVSDSNLLTCPTVTTSTSSCASENDVCATMFESSDSDLRACFAVVDPRPYLDACRRQLCDQEQACDLATAYRMRCEKLGAKIEAPQSCVTCQTEVDEPAVAMETVFVMEGGSCITNLRATLPRLLRLLGAGDENSRYGLVVYDSTGVNMHTVTIDGQLMGTAHSLEKMLKRFVEPSTSSTNSGAFAVEALKQAAMYPFKAASKRNIVMLTCSDCQTSPKIDQSEVVDMFNNFEINFHLIRNQEIETKASRTNKPVNSKNYVVGYDKIGAFTKKSIRGENPTAIADQLNQVLVSQTEICSNMLSSVNDGSVWSAPQLATRTRTAGKPVTAAVAKRLAGVTPASNCANCRCVSFPSGITRQICTAC